MEQYELLEVLGRGSFGVAHLAKQRPGVGREIAPLRVVKEISLSDMPASARSQAWREAQVLKSLCHVNIIAHIGTFLQDDSLYIVMEYADGGDLAAALRQKRDAGARFGKSDVVSIFVQACNGLQHTHSKRVLHRDLKPQNIFMTQAGVVKLGDFGIAKVLENTAAKAASMLGTPYYSSPEVCDSRPYNLKADIWSLGAVLYELMALEPPFKATNLVTLMLRIIHTEPKPLPPDYGEDLLDLVRMTLQKDPLERPSCEALLAMPSLRRVVSRPPPPPGPPPEPPPTRAVDVPASCVLRPSRRVSSCGAFRQNGVGKKLPAILQGPEPPDAVEELLKSLERRQLKVQQAQQCPCGHRSPLRSRASVPACHRRTCSLASLAVRRQCTAMRQRVTPQPTTPPVAVAWEDDCSQTLWPPQQHLQLQLPLQHNSSEDSQDELKIYKEGNTSSHRRRSRSSCSDGTSSSPKEALRVGEESINFQTLMRQAAEVLGDGEPLSPGLRTVMRQAMEVLEELPPVPCFPGDVGVGEQAQVSSQATLLLGHGRPMRAAALLGRTSSQSPSRIVLLQKLFNAWALQAEPASDP